MMRLVLTYGRYDCRCKVECARKTPLYAGLVRHRPDDGSCEHSEVIFGYVVFASHDALYQLERLSLSCFVI